MIRLISRSSTDPSRVSATRLTGARVLVVEDDDDARELVGVLLANAGAEVMLAGSAEEAFRTLTTQTPDVIVSDVGMPEEDGLAMLRRLRALPASEGGTIPVVALTAFASARDQTDAQAAGFTVHMAKPVDSNALIDIVHALRTSTHR